MNKKILIGILVAAVILIAGTVGIKLYNKAPLNSEAVNGEEIFNTDHIEGAADFLKFLEAISGVKANSIEIINDPIGFEGEFFAPDEAIINGLNFFLKETNNEKMENLSIISEDGAINIKIDYRVTNNLVTPIEVKVKPTINEEKDLVINIQEVRFLDLKIAKWIVNLAMDNFIEDWFPQNGEFRIDIDKSSVTIYKENFNGVEIKSISLENGLEIKVIIDLEKILRST